MAQTGTGVAQFSKEIDNWLTNEVGDDLLQFRDDSLTALLNKWIEYWQKSLETAKRPGSKGVGHIASGRLYQSLGTGWVFNTLGKRVQIQLILPSYWSATDTGRKPTNSRGNGALKKALSFEQGRAGGWIAQRKLIPSGGMELFGRKLTAAQANKALSFLIARKIHKKGFEGSGWFSKDMNKFRSELEKAVEQQFGKGAKFNLQILGK